jgi:hypothetical protein
LIAQGRSEQFQRTPRSGSRPFRTVGHKLLTLFPSRFLALENASERKGNPPRRFNVTHRPSLNFDRTAVFPRTLVEFFEPSISSRMSTPTSLLYANPLNRYLINAAMLPNLKRDADGGITSLRK